MSLTNNESYLDFFNRLHNYFVHKKTPSQINNVQDSERYNQIIAAWDKQLDYEKLFNKIYDYLIHKKIVYKISNFTEADKFNEIITRLENNNKIKQQFINFFRLPLNEELIVSIFQEKSPPIISNLKRLLSIEDNYRKILRIVNQNSKFQIKIEEGDKLIDSLKEVFVKLKQYDSIFELIAQYPNQANIQKLSKALNEESLRLSKKKIQDICYLKSTLKDIEDVIHKRYYLQTKTKHSTLKQLQQVVLQRIAFPLDELIGNFQYLRKCLPNITNENSSALQQCINEAYNQDTKFIKSIVQWQKNIQRNFKEIKEKAQDIIKISNYPVEESKPANFIKNLEDVNKKMLIIQQIFQSYDDFFKTVKSHQKISQKRQQYDSKSKTKYIRNSNPNLKQKRQTWKKEFQIYAGIASELSNNQNGSSLGADSNHKSLADKQLLSSQIKKLNMRINQSELKLNEANKSKIQMKSKLQQSLLRMSYISRQLGIQIEQPMLKQSFPYQAITQRVKDLMHSSQKNQQLKQKLKTQQAISLQAANKNNDLEQRLRDVSLKLTKAEQNNFRFNRQNEENVQLYRKLLQENRQLKCEYNRVQSQNQFLRQKLSRVPEVNKPQSAKIEYYTVFEQSKQILVNSLHLKIRQIQTFVLEVTQLQIEKIIAIQKNVKRLSDIIAFKKQRSRQLKEELDQTRRESQIIQQCQQKERTKVGELIKELAEKKKQISDLNRQISEHKRQIKNIECDLEIEKENINSLNLEIERYQLELSMIESNTNTDNTAQIINAYNQKIEKMLQNQKIIHMQLVKNGSEVQKLKNELQYQRLQKKVIQENLDKTRKENQLLTEKLNREKKQVKNQSCIIQFQQHQNQFKTHKQQLQKFYLAKFGSKNQEQAKSLCLAYIDKLFQGELLQEFIQYKYRIVCHLQQLTPKKVLKTNLIYKMDRVSTVNFHKYIDGVKNLLTLVKTKKGMFLVGFYMGTYGQFEMTEPGILIAVNKNESFLLKEPVNAKKFRGMVYDEYFIVYGNAELRIRTGEHTFFSNFGINNSYYNSKNKKLNYFAGEDDHDIQIISYEIYSIIFEEEESRWEG